MDLLMGFRDHPDPLVLLQQFRDLPDQQVPLARKALKDAGLGSLLVDGRQTVEEKGTGKLGRENSGTAAAEGIRARGRGAPAAYQGIRERGPDTPDIRHRGSGRVAGP